jgi:predicted AAA+ superfamily ATPase
MSDQMIARWAAQSVEEAMADTRVAFVMGARQVGKSTLVSRLAAEHGWGQVLSLDDKPLRDAAAADPTGFVAALPRPAIVDEVQRVPDLLLAIKEAVDRETRPGQFLLTGSANIVTNRRVKDALTGRMDVITLWPLSQGEIHRADNVVDALFQARIPTITDSPVGIRSVAPAIVEGGVPEARHRTGRRRDRWFANYVDTTLDRDLRDISDAQKLDEIPRLLGLLATQAAGLVNYANLADRLQLNERTVKSYVELLEVAFLVKRLPAWRPGLASREVHVPKVHLVDTGLLMYLLGADESRLGHDDLVTGKAVENLVAMELVKQATTARVDSRCYHYRFGRDEVDVVLESRAGDIVGIEVKASATPSGSDRRGLEKLRDLTGERFKAGVIAYTGSRTIPLGDRLWALPITGLWHRGAAGPS